MGDPLFEDILAQTEEGLNEIEELFREEGFFERMGNMVRGFAATRDSRAYKVAQRELQRLWAPICAIVIPLIAIAILFMAATGQMGRETVIEVQYMKAEEIEILDEPEVPPEPVPVEFTPVDVEFTTDTAVPTLTAESFDAALPAMTAQPAAMDSVLHVKSPIIMRGMVGVTRNAGVRGKLLQKYGGNQQTEDAVMRALRWLKKRQADDGSWPQNREAMTGLAILTFLAHGEIPGQTSPEFGETVRRAIEYLIRRQNPGSGRISSSYSHAIATYALCEAYGMTMNPNVKEAADKAVYVLVNGQNPGGGWDYGLAPCERDDTSVAGWCAQALKAAHLANAYFDNEALDTAMKKAIRGFIKNSNSSGGFGYVGPGNGGLSGVGTLCMQLLGAGNSSQVKRTQELMDSWVAAFTPDQGGLGPSTQYYYYYATQAKFHDGGKRWERWNDKMWPIYVKEQKIEKEAIEDVEGKLQDIGWWENADAATDRPVMDTCLAALQLMVYYRNLPTTQAEAVKVNAIVEAAGEATLEGDDVKVDLGDL